jgi:hypothetical protein
MMVVSSPYQLTWDGMRSNPPIFFVNTFGAIQSDVIDSTAAINAAIDTAFRHGGGDVILSTPPYKVQTILHKPGIRLVGIGASINPFGSVLDKATLIGTDGFDVIQFVPDGSLRSGYGLENIVILDGENSIKVPASSVTNAYVRMRNCAFYGPTIACINIDPGLSTVEEWYLNDVQLSNGQYCFYCRSRLDKCVFDGVETKQPSLNHWRFDMPGTVSNSLTWINPIFHLAGQHGMHVTGDPNSLQQWTFINPYSEGDGQTGKNNRTTGSITNGTNSLTVASATGYVIGDLVTVDGAGTAGRDLSSVATNVVGNVITLTNNASTTVSNVAVTNARYDAFFFESGIRYITMINPYFGEGSGGHLRYAANFTADTVSSQIIGGGGSTNFPIYDPLARIVALGSAVIRIP